MTDEQTIAARASAKTFRMMARGAIVQSNLTDPDGTLYQLVKVSPMQPGRLGSNLPKLQQLIEGQNAALDERNKRIAALEAELATAKKQLADAIHPEDDKAEVWIDNFVKSNEVAAPATAVATEAAPAVHPAAT